MSPRLLLLALCAVIALALLAPSVSAHPHRKHGTPVSALTEQERQALHRDLSEQEQLQMTPALNANNKLSTGPLTCAEWPTNPPRFWSFHLHLLFDAKDANATAAALQLRKDFIQTHKPNATCHSLYQGKEGLCMFDTVMEPEGPFMQAQWAIFIPLDYYVPVVSWVLQRHALSGGRITKAGLPGIERQPFSVLVHPNTGCEYEDHSIWSMWAGQPKEISMQAMTEEVPFDIIPPWDPRCQGC